MQFNVLKNDRTVDVQFNLCNEDTVKFWCELFNGDEYKELASLGLLLLTICPTSVICERGFSIMNYVKNQYHRSVLSQDNLNACMAICMTNQTDRFSIKELFVINMLYVALVTTLFHVFFNLCDRNYYYNVKKHISVSWVMTAAPVRVAGQQVLLQQNAHTFLGMIT